MPGDPAGAARALMDRFAETAGPCPAPHARPGADPVAEAGGARPSRRYLWTDAFAVCNWLGLGRVERAAELVETVHATLGRHRDDDPREGWISGLPEEEGARRPTAGGLRIGKPLPERSPDEPYDPRLEWDRDGQYFHYLTRWMRALRRMAEVTGEARYQRWAVELGGVAYDRFSHGIGPIPNRLYWKMSIDLSRPLVPSMGQHDPLDGFVAMSELEAGGGAELGEALDGLVDMGEGADWATDDALGAGSLLADAWFLARLGGDDPRRVRLLERVLDAGARSVRQVRESRLLELPATHRLPFRELGLCIGLSAVERLESLLGADAAGAAAPPSTGGHIEAILSALPLRDGILEMWLDGRSRDSSAWKEHEDINTVMLATAAAPDGYLGSPSGR